MNEMSIFENFNKVSGNRNFTVIAEQIRNGRFRQQVEDLRALLIEGKEKEYSARKKSLPAFTPSGRFDGRRKAEFLQEYSRLIILDLDKIQEIETIRKKVVECGFTYSCFISPSGNGLKILIRTDNSVTKHREGFLEVQAYYEKLLNIKIDPSGKDLTRLCFFSWDPEIYLNNESEIFKTKKEMSIKSDIENLIEQIDGKQVDITSNYDDWLKIGFSLESEFGESGRTYFHDISRHNNTYNSEACNEQYTKCLKNNNSGITIKTLFHIAKQYGVTVKSINKRVENNEKKKGDFPVKESKSEKSKERKKITSNKFTIAEEYLNQRYDIRYNTVSNKFEYKEKDVKEYEDLNENNMYVRL
ncbi:MAG: BT4734/BF3469 family protein, partial [Bacteroidota bacterium]